MIYTGFQDKKLSMLGFGTMRLPTLEGGAIDEAQVAEMVKYALDNGVNYFDTAYPYHGGMSEIVIGKVLSEYPRDSYYLATKYPGHQISSSYDLAAVFEEQLKKCGVEYFDFYLLHNVYENSIQTYLDPRWDIIGYFREQKRLGRIRHLGFSCHGRVENLREFLDAAGDDMEFCQIQLNWLDWTLQDAKAKVELLNERNIPVWVMEPVRGGAPVQAGRKRRSCAQVAAPGCRHSRMGISFPAGNSRRDDGALRHVQHAADAGKCPDFRGMQAPERSGDLRADDHCRRHEEFRSLYGMPLLHRSLPDGT